MRPRGQRGRWDDVRDSEPLPAYLRRIGYSEHGIRTGVDPRRHVLWKWGGAPAIDAVVFDFWLAHDEPLITIVFTSGAVWSISMDVFARESAEVDHGHGVQRVVPASKWTKRTLPGEMLLFSNGIIR
jgi:hypothetical protein